MGYELTDDDIGNLFRILVGKTRTFEGDVRSWFATLPVVAAGTPEPTEPPPSEAARPGDVAATEEDAAAYGDVFDQEYHARARAPGEYMAARVAALNVVYRRMRARERPAPSGPDPLAEPTASASSSVPSPPFPPFEATDWQIEVGWLIDACESLWTYTDTIRWSSRETNTQEWLDGLRECIAASRAATIRAALWLKSSTSPSAPEPTPPPPAADYMVYHPDRIEFRAKGDGEHDPVVARITAGEMLAALRVLGETVDEAEMKGAVK